MRPDVVMHLAAESHVDRSIDGPGAFIQTNIVGTYTLLQAALGYWRRLTADAKERFRFHHISTDEVFGSLDDGWVISPKTTPYRPNSPYSASKASADHLVRAWHHTYGLPIVLTNCSNNYGPYHFPEKLIPLTILNALEGEPLPVYGNGDECARLALCRRPRPRAAHWSRAPARSARPTASAAAASAAISTW